MRAQRGVSEPDPFDIARYRPELRQYIIQNGHLVVAHGHNLAVMDGNCATSIMFLQERLEAFESRDLLPELGGRRSRLSHRQPFPKRAVLGCRDEYSNRHAAALQKGGPCTTAV